MMNLAAILGLGFVLGVRHATDPDHVIAVTTIVSRERNLKHAAQIGVAWGIGHTLTILAVGFPMILFRIVLPPRIGLAMELAVALMLVVLGIRNMGGIFGFIPGQRSSSAAPSESGTAHYYAVDSSHAHSGHHSHGNLHDASNAPLRVADRWFGSAAVYQMVRPLLVGIVHGMAGSAAIALLVLSTIPSVRWAVAYLLIFGTGTVLGMMLMTTTLGSAFSFGQTRLGSVGRHFGLAAGVMSFAFGLFLAYQISFVDGLFTLHATWVPR